MRDRSLLGALLLIGLVVPLTSCVVEPALTLITVSPSTETSSFSAGLLTQFTAIGTYTRPGHAAVTRDITNQVTWASANTQMVTIGVNTGLASVVGISYGNTTISAAANGFHGDIVGTADYVVSAPPTTTASISLSIIRSSRGAASLNGTVHFTAIGRTAEGASVDLTDKITWTSSNEEVATIDARTGVATTLGPGATAVVAVFKNPDGTTAASSVPLTVSPAI